MFGREYDYTLIRTTSKDALKRTALMATGNDIKKAMEIYDFFAKDLPNMPDFDPIPPNGLEQIKNTAVQAIKWGQENKEQVQNIVGFLAQLFNRQPISVPMEAPPPPIQ